MAFALRALISRDRAVHKAFSFARTLRDAIQVWAARIGPQLAMAFDLDAAAVTIYLDPFASYRRGHRGVPLAMHSSMLWRLN